MEIAIFRGFMPKIRPRAVEPRKNAFPRENFFLMRMTIKTKIRRTLAMAGMLMTNLR